MDRDMLFDTVLPMAVAIVLLLAFIVCYLRFFQGHTERAREAFEKAIQVMVERFHLTYHPPSGPYDWPQATGSHRDHSMAFLIVSETESPMRTGLIVRLERPFSLQVLARVKARRPFIRGGRNLEIRSSAASDGAPLPPETDRLLGALLAVSYEVRIEPERIFVTLQTRKHNFFDYDVLTDPERLSAAAEAAVDLAIELEAAEA